MTDAIITVTGKITHFEEAVDIVYITAAPEEYYAVPFSMISDWQVTKIKESKGRVLTIDWDPKTGKTVSAQAVAAV